MKTKILMLPLAAVLLLGACKGSGSHYDNKRKSEGADTAAIINSDAEAQTKLVKTADMQFKVKDVRQTSEDIAILTAKNNGIVMNHHMQTTIEGSQDMHISNDSVMHISSFNTVADMTVKIPPEHLEDFMNQVAHMGIYIISRKMDADDKSLDFLSAKLKQKNKQAFINQQSKNHESDASAELAMKDDIVDGQINNLKIDKEVKYSTLILSFYQNKSIVKEVLVNDDPSAYQLPLFKRFSSALAFGWSIFAELILWIANLWVFILAGMGTWMLIRFYRRKNPTLPGAIKS